MPHDYRAANFLNAALGGCADGHNGSSRSGDLDADAAAREGWDCKPPWVDTQAGFFFQADTRGPRVRAGHALAGRDGGVVPVRGDDRPAAAAAEVKADMELPADGPARRRRRRLRQDRGRAARRVQGRPGGKQVAVLVPTTVLAAQHDATFSQRFAAFPLEVRLLSRFVSPRRPGGDDRGPGRRHGRHRHRDAPAAEQGHPVQGPRARRGRRGAAVRGGGQGTAQAAPARGRRPDPVGDADPADAQPGPRRDPRPARHRDAARGPAADPDAGRRGVGRARPRRDPARARPRRPGLLRPQPGRDDRGPGRAAPPDAARRPVRRRPRPDGRGRPREGDDRLRRRRGRRPGVHDDHRIRAGHPERQHDRHRSRGHARAGPALPASRPGRALVAAGLRVPPVPPPGAAVGRGAQAAAGDLQRVGARRRASRSRCPTSRSAAPATSWAASSPGTWRRSGSTCTRGCWPRRSRRARPRWRAGRRSSRRRRPSSTCRSRRTCPTTTSRTRPRSSSSTGGSRGRDRPATWRPSARRSSTATDRCPTRSSGSSRWPSCG